MSDTALVHGVAVAGAAVARALAARGYRVLVADDSPDAPGDAKRALAHELGTELVERPDADTIARANELGVAMVFTGERQFKH